MGQLLSLMICGTAVSCQYLADAGVETPMLQSFLNYALLLLAYSTILCTYTGIATVLWPVIKLAPQYASYVRLQGIKISCRCWRPSGGSICWWVWLMWRPTTRSSWPTATPRWLASRWDNRKYTIVLFDQRHLKLSRMWWVYSEHNHLPSHERVWITVRQCYLTCLVLVPLHDVILFSVQLYRLKVRFMIRLLKTLHLNGGV